MELLGLLVISLTASLLGVPFLLPLLWFTRRVRNWHFRSMIRAVLTAIVFVPVVLPAPDVHGALLMPPFIAIPDAVSHGRLRIIIEGSMEVTVAVIFAVFAFLAATAKVARSAARRGLPYEAAQLSQYRPGLLAIWLLPVAGVIVFTLCAMQTAEGLRGDWPEFGILIACAVVLSTVLSFVYRWRHSHQAA